MRKKYKTKFPVARIKKIMQMDEDVGKVAQATPILISKALELFMQSLIDEACMETRSKNAKRLTAAHLKKTILDKDQFDFLRDIVQNVPDPQGGSSSGAGAGPGAGAGAGSDEASHSGSSSRDKDKDKDKERDSGKDRDRDRDSGGSSSNSHQNQGGSSSSSSTKMEVDDKAYSDFAGAMAAARRGAPKAAAGPKKQLGRSVKDEEDDDYDNE